MHPAVVDPGTYSQKLVFSKPGIGALSWARAFSPEHAGDFTGNLGGVLVPLVFSAGQLPFTYKRKFGLRTACDQRPRAVEQHG